MARFGFITVDAEKSIADQHRQIATVSRRQHRRGHREPRGVASRERSVMSAAAQP
jgi:hypothetical protein